jgi:hypothetical protein
VHPTAPGYLTYVGDFGGRGLDVFDFKPAGGVAADGAKSDDKVKASKGKRKS